MSGAKRARTMDASRGGSPPNRITQPLGGDETYSMRDLFQQWGLPAKFHQGMSPGWRCKLVPIASDTVTQRTLTCEGVPFLVPTEHAQGVFDAMNSGNGGTSVKSETSGGGEDPGDDNVKTERISGSPSTSTHDCVSWACDSEWSTFVRPKVAMVGGWGAPGSHLLSERYMRMVDSFADVVDGDEPLNLQMFHREDGGGVPVLPTHLNWPLPEFFDTNASEEVKKALEEVEARKIKTEIQTDPSIKTEASALPAQGASRRVGGVGVPLDMATRLSAAGALTWWHLDDCGEFVFQVGLPIDENLPKRRNAKREPPPILLGPNGKPVVKLFIFVEKEDYEWIAQDGVMNSTMKQSALDLFDTPEHYVPSEEELREPFSTEPLSMETKSKRKEKESDRSSLSSNKSSRLPVFWVAPLEAGGPPLLSPPNVIHCVLTTRDCVMVEERKLSLLFMDEVEYFRRRAAKWCEPPVQYRFVREDLLDADRCRAGAVLPLLKTFRDARVALEEGIEETGEMSDRDEMERQAMILARAMHSLHILLSQPNTYVMDATTRVAIDAEFAKYKPFEEVLLNLYLLPDQIIGGRREKAVSLFERMALEGVGNAHRMCLDVGKPPVCAMVHEKGRPRWGPARGSVEETSADRKAMRNAIKNRKLDELLRKYRG